MFTTGNETVDSIGKMHLEGNTIPHLWYENIRFENNKPDLIAIIILAEIVYWYRPTYMKDETTGQTLGMKKRFSADLLQRSYESFADQFGVSKRQAKDAIVRLENMGLIKRHFRTINPHGTPLSNVLFIELSVGHLGGVTFKRQRVSHPNVKGSDIQTPEVLHLNVTPMTSQCQTYTEITTEITTNINNDDNKVLAYAEEHQKPKTLNAFQFFEQNGFGFISHHVAQKIDDWSNDLSEELVIHAMEQAVENNVYTWKYVEVILKDWTNKKFKSISEIQADDKRREAAKKSKSQRQQPRGREERVPEWFHSRNEDTSKQTTPQVEQDGQPIDFEAERRKILDMLGKNGES